MFQSEYHGINVTLLVFGMIEFNLYGVVMACFVGAFLLGIFNKQDDRQGWFS